MDWGLILMSLVIGFCSFCVIDIVLCNDMFMFGNFFVVILEALYIEALVFETTR